MFLKPSSNILFLLFWWGCPDIPAPSPPPITWKELVSSKLQPLHYPKELPLEWKGIQVDNFLLFLSRLASQGKGDHVMDPVSKWLVQGTLQCSIIQQFHKANQISEALHRSIPQIVTFD